MSPQRMTIDGVWAERLAAEGRRASSELGARFDFLSSLVLDSEEMPPASSAEFATAYGDLLILEWFIADVRRAMTGQETYR